MSGAGCPSTTGTDKIEQEEREKEKHRLLASSCGVLITQLMDASSVRRKYSAYRHSASRLDIRHPDSACGIPIRHAAFRFGIRHSDSACGIPIRQSAFRFGMRHPDSTFGIPIRHAASRFGSRHPDSTFGIPIRHAASPFGMRHPDSAVGIPTRHSASPFGMRHPDSAVGIPTRHSASPFGMRHPDSAFRQSHSSLDSRKFGIRKPSICIVCYDPSMWDPMRDWRTWQERLTSPGADAWTPPIDVYETAESYVIAAEVPGMRREEIELALEDSRLTIRGRRNDRSAAGGNVHFHQVERGHGPFARSFEFASKIDTSAVSAELSQGILTITLPKAVPAPPRKIEVR
jgi:HSP20 family protein